MLLSHFTVFYFMSCLDISEWKAVLTETYRLVIFFMIDVTMKEISCKQNANCLISTQFLVVLRNQALRNNFDLCLSGAVGISA